MKSFIYYEVPKFIHAFLTSRLQHPLNTKFFTSKKYLFKRIHPHCRERKKLKHREVSMISKLDLFLPITTLDKPYT